MFHSIGKPAALACALFLIGAPGHAQSAPEAPLAQVGIEKRMQALAADAPANAFELGLLGTLRAVEKTLQTRFRHGLGDRISGLPLLRLNTPGRGNPMPEPVAPDTLSGLVATFVSDMAEARIILAGAERAGIHAFDLTLQDLWFDVDLNGIRDKGEDAMDILGPVLLDPRTRREMNKPGADTVPIRVRFDAADHAWLTAYTYMLSGVGNLYLAYDPAPVIAEMATARDALKQAPRIPNFYDQDAIKAEIAALEAELDAADMRQKELRTLQRPTQEQVRALRSEMRLPANKDRRAEFDARIDALNEGMKPLQEESRALSQQQRFLRNERQAAQGKLAQADEDETATDAGLAQIEAQLQATAREHVDLKKRKTALAARLRELTALLEQSANAATRAEVQARVDATKRATAEVDAALASTIKTLRTQERALFEARLRDGGSSRRGGQMDSVRTGVDLVYIVLKAIEQQPDRERIKAAHADLMQMIAFNRVFWRAVALETDNEAEWIPNPAQTSALGVEVSADLARAWQAILADAEAVLEGRLLLPHPLLPEGYGIDLTAFVLDPGPIDLIAWIQGIGVYPYAARGPRITAQNWTAFSRLTQGRASMYSLFFN